MMFTNSARIERWLGSSLCEDFSAIMRNWYGTPIPLDRVPGHVSLARGGEFVGKIKGGYFASLDDYIDDAHIRERKRRLAELGRRKRQLGGFTGTFYATKMSQHQPLPFVKTLTSNTAGVFASGFRAATVPAAGSAAAAAPGGTVPTNATSGAIAYVNPTASGATAHYLGMEFNATNPGAILLYDRIFAVAKTMNSTATEAVTGTPSRYQNSTLDSVDSAQNNFLFPEVGTVLPATAHNWTVCQYTDESGNTANSIPSVTGTSSAAANSLDIPTRQFFMPLASGDVGVKALTQMQCSALVATGTIDFVIGHPIAFIPVTHSMTLNAIVRDERISCAANYARIFDNACLALLAFSNTGTQVVSGIIKVGAR